MTFFRESPAPANRSEPCPASYPGGRGSKFEFGARNGPFFGPSDPKLELLKVYFTGGLEGFLVSTPGYEAAWPAFARLLLIGAHKLRNYLSPQTLE